MPKQNLYYICRIRTKHLLCINEQIVSKGMQTISESQHKINIASNDMKVYPAKEVVPLRSPVLNTIKSLNKDEAINFSNKKIASVRAVITRLHKDSTIRYKTVKVSLDEFAVIRIA